MIHRALWLVLGINISLYGVFWQITQPGYYQLGGDIAYDPGVTINDAIIQISSDNVVIDLGENTLSQIGSTAGLRGILVDSGLSNVMIKNGSIASVTGFGTVVSNACTNIVIDSVTFISCLTGGISLAGAASPNQIQHTQLLNCVCIGSGQSAGSDAIGFSLSRCVNVDMIGCSVMNSGNTSNSVVGVSIANSSLVTIQNTAVKGCVGGSVTGFLVSQSSSNNFWQCLVAGSSVSAANTFAGFDVSGLAAPDQSNFNIFDSCIVQNNAAITVGVGATVVGFLVRSNVQNSVFRNCIVDGNTLAGTSLNVGYLLSGDTTTMYNSFIDCIALGLLSTGNGALSAGLSSTGGSVNGLIQYCIASNNSAASGGGSIGVGLDMSGSGGSFWTVQNNHFSRNIGVNSNNSFGIRELVGVNNLYSENIGFRNGATVGNQLNSIPAGSTTTPAATASSNMAAVAGVWTNIAVAA